MNTPRTVLASMALGIALGAALVVACGDDSPGNADAATCDCPAAEPPLAGRIITQRATGNITANGGGVAGALCPEGATILGGSCYFEGSNDNRIVVNRAGFNRQQPTRPYYECNFTSTSPENRIAVAEAVCLMPAQ